MLTGTNTRLPVGTDPEDYPDLTEEDAYSTRDVEGDEWIGEIVTIPHPNSGHMEKSMAKVTDVETATAKTKTNRAEVINEDAEPEYEQIEVDKLITEDLLLGTELSVIQHSMPSANFVEHGETYAVYGLQHQNGCGEWVTVSYGPSSEGWTHNPFVLKSFREDYTGHEKTRIVKRSVTHYRNDDAHPSDTDGYLLEYETEPVTIERPDIDETNTEQTA